MTALAAITLLAGCAASRPSKPSKPTRPVSSSTSLTSFNGSSSSPTTTSSPATTASPSTGAWPQDEQTKFVQLCDQLNHGETAACYCVLDQLMNLIPADQIATLFNPTTDPRFQQAVKSCTGT